ncbi:MAG: hypothetical protein KJT03_14155 [Verrucomicrobiae bacterium]|nr:hypothetical protein [Verrucomicrobiae bacterium]
MLSFRSTLPLLVILGLHGFTYAGDRPLATKGEPILSNNFGGSLKRGEIVELGQGWQRRVSFGTWTIQPDGSVTAANVPGEGHGPVLTFLKPMKNIIIECEFMIPASPEENRHFRIFLDEEGFRGHNIQSTANVSSVFRPVGFTLQHLRKDENQATVQNVDIGPVDLELKPNTWYTLRLDVLGDQAWTTVAGKTLTMEHPVLRVDKNKIGLNPGIAGGTIRNFKAWAVKNGR